MNTSADLSGLILANIAVSAAQSEVKVPGESDHAPGVPSGHANGALLILPCGDDEASGTAAVLVVPPSTPIEGAGSLSLSVARLSASESVALRA